MVREKRSADATQPIAAGVEFTQSHRRSRPRPARPIWSLSAASPRDNATGGNLILLGRFDGNELFSPTRSNPPEPPQLIAVTVSKICGWLPRFCRRRGKSGLAELCARHDRLARPASLLRQLRRDDARSQGRPCTGVHQSGLAAHEQFPRIDPAIIVLVSDGDRALLGRQASWPAWTLFNHRRICRTGEIARRTPWLAKSSRSASKSTGSSTTHRSPGPFPSSLMLGFTAHALTTQIMKRDQELEDAQWFTRADPGQTARPIVPPNVSISFRLIEHWFDAGGGPPLRETLKASTWPASR